MDKETKKKFNIYWATDKMVKDLKQKKIDDDAATDQLFCAEAPSKEALDEQLETRKRAIVKGENKTLTGTMKATFRNLFISNLQNNQVQKQTMSLEERKEAQARQRVKKEALTMESQEISRILTDCLYTKLENEGIIK